MQGSFYSAKHGGNLSQMAAYAGHLEGSTTPKDQRAQSTSEKT